MKYIKIINEQTFIKPLKEIIIYKNGKQIFNPTSAMVLEDGWSEYEEPKVEDPTPAQLLEQERQTLIDLINQYDNSEAVNSCIIKYGGSQIKYWANKTERSSLKTAIQDCLAMNRTEYRLDLRDIGIYISVNCEMLLQMLSALEVYAIDCYNKTTDHIFNAQALQTIEEIKNYDYTKGYPELLVINFSLVE